jgi:hypothetical protein
MINMQILGGAVTAMAILVGASIALALALWASASVRHSGQTPNGGIRRDPPQPDRDDDRELVLL